MKNIVLILMAAILSSCSAQWHMRKAIAKDPTILKNYTVTVIDTVEFNLPEIRKVDTSSTKVDTLKIVEHVKDSTGITQDQADKAVDIALREFNKSLESDTLIVDTLNLVATSYYNNGKNYLILEQKDSVITQEHRANIETSQVVIDPKPIYRNTWFWVSVFLFVVLFYVNFTK